VTEPRIKRMEAQGTLVELTMNRDMKDIFVQGDQESIHEFFRIMGSWEEKKSEPEKDQVLDEVLEALGEGEEPEPTVQQQQQLQSALQTAEEPQQLQEEEQPTDQPDGSVIIHYVPQTIIITQEAEAVVPDASSLNYSFTELFKSHQLWIDQTSHKLREKREKKEEELQVKRQKIDLEVIKDFKRFEEQRLSKEKGLEIILTSYVDKVTKKQNISGDLIHRAVFLQPRRSAQNGPFLQTLRKRKL
jgi:hypothetical protein